MEQEVICLKLKTRNAHKLTLSGWETFYGTPMWNKGVIELGSRQLTLSEGHPWPKGRGSDNVGGPFDSIKIDFDVNYDASQVFTTRPGGTSYRGSIFPDPNVIGSAVNLANTGSDALYNFCPSLGDNTLGVRGVTAINSTAPTAPVVDGAVGLAELYREGVPHIIGGTLLKSRAKDLLTSAGSEYLNYEFGWKPLVSDLKDASKAIIESETILKQLRRDSGRNVRRRYTFPVERTEDFGSRNYLFPWPTLDSTQWQAARYPTYRTSTEREVWFSGCFTYHFPAEFHNKVEEVATMARLLYGVKLTPDVVWNLAPWSWLADWAVNIGPILSNVALFANDGLTLRYGYTMEKTTVRQYTFHHGLSSPGGGRVPSDPALLVTGVRKKRIMQSPYVLGLVGKGLSLRQGAILSALGITRR